MPKTLEAITHDVLELPRADRMALAQIIFDHDESPADPNVEAAWEEEIRARLEAYREGRLACVSHEQVMAEIEAKLRECR